MCITSALLCLDSHIRQLLSSSRLTCVKHLDLWLHLFIDLINTGLSMASDYCMQLQASPTRADIDGAHAKGEWLDIGVPSFRTLGKICRWRKFTWLLFAVSSLPIHLM